MYETGKIDNPEIVEFLGLKRINQHLYNTFFQKLNSDMAL